MSALKNKIFVSLTLTIFLTIINEPIFSHGSNGDCSDECNSYYCPDKSRDSDQRIKNKNNN